MINIVLVQPNALRTFWDSVRQGLEALPKAEWIPEDIYHLVKSGQAALFYGWDADRWGYGFVVLRQTIEEFTGAVNCHVLAAYSTPGSKLYRPGLRKVREIAEQMGANSIVFGSPRKGWGKRFPVVDTTYSIPMDTNE